MTETAAVLDHHLAAFDAGDLDAVLADYAEDAVLVQGERVFEGRNEIRAFFEDLFAEFDDPETSFTLDQRTVVGNYAYITWHAETPANVYEFATDTFVVRDGDIQAQTVAAVVTPKA